MLETKQVTHSFEETEELGRKLAKTLPLTSILVLYGDLGCGKTTFVRGLAREATANPSLVVDSPTFVYLNIYEGIRSVYHFDAYRLKGPQDFTDEGFDEFFEKEGVVVIEWPERIEALIPPEALRIYFKHLGEGTREIKIVSHEKIKFE